jgi:hypothetical protein
LSANDDMDNNMKFLFRFTKSILKFDKSIRWIGITDQNGNIINERDRKGLNIPICVSTTINNDHLLKEV